jgi:sulfatase-modifying factor enzyme 1
VSEVDAKAYCKTQGGRLPSIPQWLAAARGPSPQRFPWGNERGSCNQHPSAVTIDNEFAVPAVRQVRRPCHSLQERYPLRTGEYHQGVSPRGLDDILITPGELVSGDESNLWSSCSKDSSACIVHGGEAGAIDAIQWLAAPARSGDAHDEITRRRSTYAYSFRCAFEEN